MGTSQFANHDMSQSTRRSGSSLQTVLLAIATQLPGPSGSQERMVNSCKQRPEACRELFLGPFPPSTWLLLLAESRNTPGQCITACAQGVGPRCSVLKTKRHKRDTHLQDPFLGDLVLGSGCVPWCRDSCLRKQTCGLAWPVAAQGSA